MVLSDSRCLLAWYQCWRALASTIGVEYDTWVIPSKKLDTYGKRALANHPSSETSRSGKKNDMSYWGSKKKCVWDQILKNVEKQFRFFFEKNSFFRNVELFYGDQSRIETEHRCFYLKPVFLPWKTHGFNGIQVFQINFYHCLHPNIIFVLADDLGYQDLGAWGAEYNTPTLDRLVSRYTKLVNKHRKSQFTPRAWTRIFYAFYCVRSLTHLKHVFFECFGDFD